MTLQYEDIEIPLLRGLSGKESKKHAQGALLLENACFDELGSVNKRNSYSTVARSDLKNILSMGEYPLIYSRPDNFISRLKMYEENRATWVDRDPYVSCRLDVDKQLLGTALTYPSLRIADLLLNTNLGYCLYSAESAQGYPNVVIKDLSSGHVVNTSTPTTRAVSERFVKVDTTGNVLIARTHTGAIWTLEDPAGAGVHANWYSAACDADGSVLLAGIYLGRLYMSTDSGATWTEPRPAGDFDKYWRSIAVDDDGSAQIACESRLWTSADTGASWTERDPPGTGAVNRNWMAVASDSDGSNLIACYAGPGCVYTSSNSGVNWTLREPAGAGVTKAWSCAASDSDGSVLIVGVDDGGDGGRLYVSVDSGANWTEAKPAGTKDQRWFSVDCDATGRNMIAVAGGSASGRAYISRDYGASWVLVKPNGLTGGDYRTACVDSDGSHFAVSEYGGYIYISIDSGLTWRGTYPAGAGENWRGIAMDSDGSNLIAGSYSGSAGHVYTTNNIVGLADDVIVWKFGIDNTTGPSGAGTVLNLGNNVIPWDACAGDTGKVGIVWVDGSNHIQLSIYDYASNSVDATYDTSVDHDTSAALCVWYGSSRYNIIYQDPTTHSISMNSYQSNGVLSFTASDIADAGIGHLTSGHGAVIGTRYWYVLSITDSTGAHHTCAGNSSSGGSVSHLGWMPWTRLASKVALVNGMPFFWVAAETDYSGYNTGDQPGYYLISPISGDSVVTDGWLTVAHALYGSAFECTPYANDRGQLPNLNQQTLVASGTNQKLWWAAPYTTDSSTSETQLAGINVTLSEFFQHFEIDRNHLLTGGYLHAVNGVHTHENGFLQYPVISALTGLATGGSMSNGAYSFVVVQEFVDEAGQLHRSAPSDPVSITLSAGGANQSVLVDIKNTYFGAYYKYTNARYVVYRTTASGATYYYAGNYAFPTSSYGLARVCICTITAADATIDDYATLYTTGGVLEAIAPPAPISICRSSDRVFLLSGDDRSEVWFSKPKEEGIATEFSDLNVIRFPEPLECIYYYDAKLFGFAKDRIYQVIGDGPDEFGQGSQFSIPQLLPCVTGCQNQYSIVETPVGLMFQSQMPVYPVPPAAPSETANRSAGIWLLSGSSIQPVPQPDDWNYYPITSAKILQKKNQVLFTLWGYLNYNAMLAYDYVAGQWSTQLVYETGARRFPFGEVVAGAHQFVSATYWYTQGSSFSSSDSMKVRTPWIKPGALVNGYGRCRYITLQMTYKSAHTLNVKVYYDYDDTTAVDTITNAVSASVVPYNVRFKPSTSRCNAFMIEIYDSSPSGTNESFSLEAVTPNIGRKPKHVLSSSKTL